MRHDSPGERFQRHYERRQREEAQGRITKRYVVAGGLLVVGLVLVFIPGPAFVFLGLAGAMLAEVSRPVARALDWTELRIRRAADRSARLWKRAGSVGRAGIVLLGLAVASVGAYGAWWVVFGR